MWYDEDETASKMYEIRDRYYGGNSYAFAAAVEEGFSKVRNAGIEIPSSLVVAVGLYCAEFDADNLISAYNAGVPLEDILC